MPKGKHKIVCHHNDGILKNIANIIEITTNTKEIKSEYKKNNTDIIKSKQRNIWTFKYHIVNQGIVIVEIKQKKLLMFTKECPLWNKEYNRIYKINAPPKQNIFGIFY